MFQFMTATRIIFGEGGARELPFDNQPVRIQRATGLGEKR
ncbi:hypothetical protein VCSRO198_0293 [Vibrio cholerae]|nr:hypothetical protein VCSRO198_0293 [Vibrio cholerae]